MHPPFSSDIDALFQCGTMLAGHLVDGDLVPEVGQILFRAAMCTCVPRKIDRVGRATDSEPLPLVGVLSVLLLLLVTLPLLKVWAGSLFRCGLPAAYR